jgi:DNA polymerase (family 10)
MGGDHPFFPDWCHFFQNELKRPDMTPIELLEEMKRLMELKGENPFKIRAFEKAIQNLSGQDDLEARARAGTLTELAGIGKGISEVLTDFLVHKKTTARDELRDSLPAGLVELTEVPGVGPKKAMQLIEELGVSSIGELEYACRENRLLKLKGFGPKGQQKILEGIEFRKSHQGQLRLVDALPLARKVSAALENLKIPFSETGALRRRLEVLKELDFLGVADPKLEAKVLEKCGELGLPVRLHFTSKEKFGYELARTTATPEHWKALGAPAPFEVPTESAFFEKLGVAFIPPESRETGEEVALAKKGGLSLVEGVRGVFHNHTTRSDGTASLEEMVIAAKKLGFEYIGISDHSQSAFYAQGLKADVLKEQEKEIRAVQEKHPEIRIFFGIESDILADGSLDYDPAVLKRFDFVIGSVHSRFKMDRSTMTERILQAIRNPHTRFIGHLTGRLLLGRPGYELEMERILEEAARHDVAIEINAHPARLDIDWRWGAELRKHQTLVSINPDAHEVEGLEDVSFGLTVARKALLGAGQVVNTRSVKEVESWLKRK